MVIQWGQCIWSSRQSYDGTLMVCLLIKLFMRQHKDRYPNNLITLKIFEKIKKTFILNVFQTEMDIVGNLILYIVGT